MPTIVLNGKKVELPGDPTVLDALKHGRVKGRYAVEINEEISSRSEHATRKLIDGDKVEIVQAVGGG